jgi:hypothetical protein
MIKKVLFFHIIALAVISPSFAIAQDVLGQAVVFNIESSYDFSGRDELVATLIRTSPTAYWYVDNSVQSEDIEESLNSLVLAFEDKIYPSLTGTFGSEWTPGIDKDTRITVLIHPMKKEAGGYTDTSDEYSKAQIPESNEREMIYLNSQYINTEKAKAFLAHEFVHLITFNQKEKNQNVIEEAWLNEARAEYAPTFLGYDDQYQGSNLQSRVRDFLNQPSDSLTEWREASPDYGVTNLFVQYLVDHYGLSILADSLKMKKTGIESLNAVLAKEGFKEQFPQIFTNWVVTVLINDCQVSEKYCYFNQNLKDLRITPLVNYLPLVGDSTLSVVNTTKDWSGNWHRFIGGKGTLRLEFQARNGAEFKVPYVIRDAEGNFTVDNLILNENGEGEIVVKDFGSQNTSLTIMPIAQNKTADFSDIEPSYSFFWSASIQGEKKESPLPSLSPLKKPISKMTRSEILARIAEIKKVILALQALLSEMSGGPTCRRITQDLYFGMKENPQVRCLQEFLKSQGPEIYPEGITNGNFYTLTQKAVIRFQEKYREEVLDPWGLTEGTGYVGSSTRAKINELLGG